MNRMKATVIGMASIIASLSLGTLFSMNVSAETNLAQADFVIEEEAGKQILTKYVGTEKHVVVPDGIDVIEYSSFEDCQQIESVILPDSVIQIGNFAFGNCTGLKSIELSDNLKSIESLAFASCENLENIELGKKVNYIGAFAFVGCSGLEKVSVASDSKFFTVKKGALYTKDMKSLYLYPASRKAAEKFTVPKSVTYIDDYAFSDNKYLKSITINGAVFAAGEGVFSNCESLEKLEFKKPYKYGFFAKNCKKLKKVILAKGTKNICAYQFMGCTSLKKITLPKGLETIEYAAFADCENLKTVKLPAGLKSIGSFAFHNCKNLKNIKFPESLKKIRKNAFKGCKKLKNISVPSTTKVEKNAF